jgi:hypothetical protein
MQNGKWYRGYMLLCHNLLHSTSETVFYFKNQNPYTFSELCKTNTIRDTDIRDTDTHGEAPQEEYGMTLMDILRLQTID